MPIRMRRDSPYWQIHIGRSTRFSSGTENFEHAKEIYEAEKERLRRLDKLGDRGAIPWDEAAQRWLNSSAKPKRRDREILEWLSESIGREAVSDVAEPDSLEAIRQDAIAVGWSLSTADRVMGTVSAVLHKCFEWKMLERTPVVPMFRPQPEEPKWLTPEEFERLCAQLPMHLVLAARLAVHTLLRMRAMLRLTWDRVDLTQARAWVPGRQQKASRTFGFALSTEAVRVLRALRSISLTASPYVFTYGGNPIDDCNTLAFQSAVTRAQIPKICWHDLRHTGASWAVQNGVTLPELMLLGDWKDYRSVLRYAHLAPRQAAAAAEKVAQWAHGQTGRHIEQKARKAR